MTLTRRRRFAAPGGDIFHVLREREKRNKKRKKTWLDGTLIYVAVNESNQPVFFIFFAFPSLFLPLFLLFTFSRPLVGAVVEKLCSTNSLAHTFKSHQHPQNANEHTHTHTCTICSFRNRRQKEGELIFPELLLPRKNRSHIYTLSTFLFPLSQLIFSCYCCCCEGSFF